MRRDEGLRARVRHVRENMTPAEQRLWHLLRAHRFDGVKFSRQVVVGPFIVDFDARMRKLAIEVDGDTHAAQVEYDARRTRYLEQQGFRVIRFTNADVMDYEDGVLSVIADVLRPAPLPNPLPRGEREQKARSPLGRGFGEGEFDG